MDHGHGPGHARRVLNVTFYGVRGSTPCSCDSTRRYGGNTSCVALEAPGRDPILFDLGTGLRFFGLTQPRDGSFRGTALVSHLHWDHVQGIPFFAPILADGAHLDVYAPVEDGTTLCEAVRSFMSPPYFPVEIEALPGTFSFTEVRDGVFDVDGAKVTVAPVPHVGLTVGYRVEFDGVSVAYVSDHQQPGVGATDVDPAVLDLCEGVDLLIHDAQFDDDEFAARRDWGHCTVDYAVEVAARAGARRLALFHHDPSHDDRRIDALLEGAVRLADRRGIAEVIAAAEGLTVSLGGGSLGDGATR
jgi:phosphoribosyl 1,2-cyclic phosphodiesterase